MAAMGKDGGTSGSSGAGYERVDGLPGAPGLYAGKGLEAVLTRKKRATPPVQPLFDGEKEAHLIRLACSQPPAGRRRWMPRLLADKLVELEIRGAVNFNTAGPTLEKYELKPHLNKQTVGHSAVRRQARDERPPRLLWRRWKMCWTFTNVRAIRTVRLCVLTKPAGNCSAIRGPRSRCLDGRIPDPPILAAEVKERQKDRNANHAKADWHFAPANARIKLKRL
ncbi:MAG: hypothetical protein WBG11_10605 [Methylocella sp.]